MSYCHYWGRPAVLAEREFLAFAQECKALRRALGEPSIFRKGGVAIGNGAGFGGPTFNGDVVSFNGKPPMEELRICRVFHRQDRPPAEFGLHWDYVKTNQRPYDELVVAVLASLKRHFPEAALSSDGGASDWARGIALYVRTTGRTAPSLAELARPAGA